MRRSTSEAALALPRFLVVQQLWSNPHPARRSRQGWFEPPRLARLKSYTLGSAQALCWSMLRAFQPEACWAAGTSIRWPIRFQDWTAGSQYLRRRMHAISPT